MSAIQHDPSRPDDRPVDMDIAALAKPVAQDTLTALADLHAGAFSRGWTAQELTILLSTPGSDALVANGNGKPVGFLLFRSAGCEAEILTLAVDPSWQRKGIARRLLRGLATLCMAAGLDELYLEVASDNDAALALYRQLKFVQTGRRPNYYNRGKKRHIDAICMGRFF